MIRDTAPKQAELRENSPRERHVVCTCTRAGLHKIFYYYRMNLETENGKNEA